MKGPQSFDDLLARDVDRYFREPDKPEPELEDVEDMALHLIECEPARCIATVLPRSASRQERLAEYYANKADCVPEELC